MLVVNRPQNMPPARSVVIVFQNAISERLERVIHKAFLLLFQALKVLTLLEISATFLLRRAGVAVAEAVAVGGDHAIRHGGQLADSWGA